MNITDKDTSYLLKLDDIDVNYISNLSLKYEGASCPLWSTNSAKNRISNEFFEFKLMAGKKSDSATESVTSQGDDTIGYPMYRCVLCNRDIPITYRKEHNSSTKHKICVKIAEAVLQRIQGHLLAEDNDEIVKGSTHTYFCTPCTVIVKNTDKSLHEASKGHQKSVLHDRYLNDLLNIYLDKDYLDSAETEYLKPSHDQKDNEDSSLPLRSDSEKVSDKASIMNKIKIHGQNFSKDEETEPVKKPTYGPIILRPINHSVGKKIVSSDDDSMVTTNEIVKKKRNQPNKKKNINLKNDSVVEEKNSVNEQNCSMGGMTSLFQISKLSRRFELSDSASEQVTAPIANKNSVSDVSKKFNSFNITNPLNNDANKSVFAQNKTINDQNGSIHDQNQTINDQNSSNDEEYHSFDETNKTDDKQHSIEEQNESADERSHSNDDINNKTDEKQSNETKPNSKTVDYIMLVNSNEFDIDAKTENKDQKSILSKSDLEKYLNHIIDLHNHKLTLINKDYIKIQTLDGCMVTVRADNFNGLCSRDGWLQCRVCMTMVDEDPVVHIYSSDHVVNVGEPFKDIHCFRKINNTFNHCIHCNDTFSNFDFHKLLESHLTALNEALSRSVPEKPIEPKKVGRTFCEPCNLYIDSHNFNSHTNGKPHKNNLALFFTKDIKKTAENVPSTSTDKTYCQICKNYVNTANFTAHKNQHAKMDTAIVDAKNSKPDEVGKIHCEPCDWEIRQDNFQAHLFGKTHQMNLTLANESNGLQKENYCATCDLYANKLSTHLTGEYHEFHVKKAAKKKIDEVQTHSSLVSGINITNQIKHVKNETICVVCNVKVPGTAQNITGHLQGRAHKTKFDEFVNNNRIVVVNNTFYCETCKCSVELSKVIDHILSQTHKNAAPELSNKRYCGKCNFYLLTADWARHLSEVHPELQNNSLAQSNNVATPKPSISTSETNSNYQMKVIADNQTLCKICNAKVPNKPESITEHINGRSHKLKFNTLLDENKIKKVNNKFFCDACEASVEQSEELEHIKAKSHKSALSLKPQSSTQKNPPSTLYHCECCEVDILNTPSSIQEHEEALGHKISEAFYKVARGLMDNSLHYHYERVANSVDTVSCRLCNITVSVENSKKHLESPTHNYKYRTTLNENKVQKVNNKLFCQICSVDVQNREELKHIRSLTHLFEKQVSLSVNSQSSSTCTTTGYCCAVCQVDVPNNPKNIKMHEQGSSHMSKLKSLSFDDEEKVLLTKRPNGREMVCSLCKSAVPVSGVSDHVRGARHRANKVAATTKPATT